MIKVIGASLLIVSLVLIMVFSKVLYKQNSAGLPYQFTLPSLFNGNEVLDTKNLLGKPYIVNVFASWCTTCHEEHKFWLDIASKKIVDIYGIDYLDTQEKTKGWLQKNGNPYVMVGADHNGSISKILGIAGVPETFVFDKNGQMVLHISGNVTFDIWNTQIKQLISN